MAKSTRTLVFSDRLKLALKRHSKPACTPSELAIQFNLNHPGKSISNQAAQKWLAGETMPTPDKLATLAAMCDVSVEWLSYGIPAARTNSPEIREDPVDYHALSASEQKFLVQFRRLNPHQQRILAEVLEQFLLEKILWSDFHSAPATPVDFLK